MALDPVIASGGTPIKLDDPMNRLATLMKMDSLQNQNDVAAIDLQTKKRTLDETNRLRDVLSDPAFDLNNPEHQRRIVAAAPTAGPAFLKANADFNQVNSLTSKNNADAAEKQAKAVDDRMKFSRSVLDMVQTPDQYLAWHQGNHSDPILGPLLAARGITPDSASANIQATLSQPGGLEKLKAQSALGLEKFFEMNKPTLTTQNLGDKSQIVATPGLGFDAPQVVSSSTIGQSADNKATNEAHIKGIGIQQAGENARQGKQLQQALTLQGFAQGKPGEPLTLSSQLESEAQLIAAGKMPPPTGMAATRPQTAALMARVSQINPDFDATSYAAKLKGAKDFGTGQQGNAMRSFAVAGQHLDQLGQLVDALDNKDNQTLNKIGNTVSTWNGGPAVTNFDAAKDVVSKEVIKAIVGAGGGVSEREELAHRMASANSPAQLKGVIKQYRDLMSAQHDALLQQRRAAGLPDSTLPKYTDSSQPSGVPQDIQALLQKHGGTK